MERPIARTPVDYLIYQEFVYNLFLLFIIHQRQKEIIKVLDQKKRQNPQFLKGCSSTKFYNHFHHQIPRLGKIYFENSKSLAEIEELKKNLTHDKKSKKTQKNKKNKSNRSKTFKGSKSKKKSQKGGFLFMLTDKKDQPITGNDLNQALSKVDEAMMKIRMMPHGEPPDEDNMGHPFANMLMMYQLSRGQTDELISWGLPQISTLINSPGNYLNYYGLYNLYNDEYKNHLKLNKKHDDAKNPSAKTLISGIGPMLAVPSIPGRQKLNQLKQIIPAKPTENEDLKILPSPPIVKKRGSKKKNKK